MRNRFIRGVTLAVACIAALIGASVPQQATASVPQQATASVPQQAATSTSSELFIGQRTDGTLEIRRDGVLVPTGAEAGLNPIAPWHFGYDIQYRICLADYTPESAVSWDPNLISQKISQGVGPTGPAHVTVFYDDMNGDVGDCGGWPLRQRINLYSYGHATDGYCSWASVTHDNGTITRATAWLNRLGDNDQCRETYTLRQNTASAVILNAAGLTYHTNGNISVMCSWETYRETYAYPQWSDFEALNRRYPNA